MSDIDRSAKEVYNKLQNRSSQASTEEIRELVREHFPTEGLAERVQSHMSNDPEISAMEVTEKWFRKALPIEYDGPDIHSLIEDFTEEVYEESN
jgi:hypothetical protein